MALKLITDRTSADVDYAKSFQGNQWSDLSSEQKAEYLLGLKGAYSYIDFNRVENAVQYLSDLLNMYGYRNTVNVKTDWTSEDIQKVSEIQRYIDNIAELKNKYYSNVEGEMPTTSNWLTVEGANYLEKILVNIENIIISMEQVFVYSGVAGTGQNRVWQQRFRRVVEPLNYKVFGNVEQATRSGKNMLKITANTQTSNGITMTVNKDNSITLNGTSTSTSYTYIMLGNPFTLPAGTYTISNGNPNVSETSFAFYDDSRNFGWTTRNILTGTFDSEITVKPYVRIGVGATINNETIYPMIVKGSYTADTLPPYEPYGVMPSPNYPSEVYGLGSRTRNLLNPNKKTTTHNGVTMVNNGDGSYTVYGTASGNTAIPLSNERVNFQKDVWYKFNVITETGLKGFSITSHTINSEGKRVDNYITSGNLQAKQATEDCTWMPEIYVAKGYTANGTFKVQLEQSKSPSDYIPNRAIEIKQKIGYNLVNTVVGKAGNLEIKRNSDGTITVNGVLDSFTTLSITSEKKTYHKKGVYSIIVENDKGKILAGDFYYYYKNTNYSRIYLWKENVQVKVQEFTDDFMFDVFTLYLNAGTYDNVTYKFQIVKGSEYKPYIPFIEVNKYIDLINHEPLMKIGDVEDVIDYEKGKILRRIGKYVFDGTEVLYQDLGKDKTFRYYTNPIINTLSVDKKALCSHFVQTYSVNGMNEVDEEKFALFNNKQIVFRMNKTTATTIEEVQSFLANQYNNNTPVIVYYPLAEPYYEEIDLPSIQKIPGEYSLTAYDEYLEGKIEKE